MANAVGTFELISSFTLKVFWGQLHFYKRDSLFFYSRNEILGTNIPDTNYRVKEGVTSGGDDSLDLDRDVGGYVDFSYIFSNDKPFLRSKIQDYKDTLQHKILQRIHLLNKKYAYDAIRFSTLLE